MSRRASSQAPLLNLSIIKHGQFEVDLYISRFMGNVEKYFWESEGEMGSADFISFSYFIPLLHFSPPSVGEFSFALDHFLKGEMEKWSPVKNKLKLRS